MDQPQQTNKQINRLFNTVLVHVALTYQEKRFIFNCLVHNGDDLLQNETSLFHLWFCHFSERSV